MRAIDRIDPDLRAEAARYLPSDWHLPPTPGFTAMHDHFAAGKPGWLEISLAHQWLGRRRRLAAGYNLYCYTRQGGQTVKVAAKDWDDDLELGEVSTQAAARWVALAPLLARVLPIASALGSPSLRVYTEDTWTSGIIKPVAGYRSGINPAYVGPAMNARRLLQTYGDWPDGVFARGYRRDERKVPEDGGVSRHTRRFGRIKSRLRNLLDPDARLEETLWVDLAKVAEVVEEVHRSDGGRRPTFNQALFYHLLHHRRMPAPAVAKLAGVPTGQVNRAAKAIRLRFSSPHSKPEGVGPLTEF